jgi:hypothetical protein
MVLLPLMLNLPSMRVAELGKRAVRAILALPGRRRGRMEVGRRLGLAKVRGVLALLLLLLGLLLGLRDLVLLLGGLLGLDLLRRIEVGREPMLRVLLMRHLSLR